MKQLMQYKSYRAKIEYDAEDNIFVGKVIGINDSLNFHGSNVVELKKAFEDSIEDYIDMCAHFGKEPEKEYKGSFNVRIPPELHRQIDNSATAEGVSLNQFIIDILENFYSTTK